MFTVLSVIIPIFLIMLIGFIATRMGLLSPRSLSDMGRYVIYIALPAVIIKTTLNIDIQTMLNYRYLLSYLLTSLTLTLIGIAFYRKILKLGKLDAAISVTGMVLPNSAFIGYPVILQLIEHPPVSAFAMALLVENICILPLCFILMDYSAIDSQRALKSKLFALLVKISKNPLLIAILIGMFGNLLHITVPQTINTTLELLAPSAVAVALFVIGGTLAQIKLARTDVSQLLSVMIGKLFFHPLIAILMLWLLLPGNYELKLALVIMTSMPMFSIYSVIGDLYGKQSFCSSAQLITNALAIVTIPVVISFAQFVFI